MSETTEQRMGTIHRYSDGVTTVEVHCPWGIHSGHIPPPRLEFHPALSLVYIGSEHPAPV